MFSYKTSERILFLLLSLLMLSILTMAIMDTRHKRELDNKIIERYGRNIEYEHYCDSIWITNPDYYRDVLIESDEFQQYIERHGQWWDN